MGQCSNQLSQLARVVFIFYSCVKNLHKLSGLTQHTLIASQCSWVRRAVVAQTGLLFKISQCWLGSHLGCRTLFQADVVIGRIHFLAAVALIVACLFKANRRDSLLLLLSLTCRPFLKRLIWFIQAHPG